MGLIVLTVHRLALLGWINVGELLRSGDQVINRSRALAGD